MFYTLLTLLGAGACGGAADGEAAGGTGGPDGNAGPASAGERGGQVAPVRPGVRVLLDDSLHLVRGRRVGLVTNHTGLSRPPDRPDAEPVSTIDLLAEHADIDLVALFGPEHGIRGEVEGGETVEHGRDDRTGVPIHSLYTSERRPPPGSLEEIDVLLFDIQDVGARYYTYVWTMALAMEAAGEAGIPFVVLDRPNPIDGVHVQGNVLDPEYATFVGLYPVPMRHGMTPGEIARLVQQAYGVEATLHVVPAAGWRREMRFEETGLPWVAPSPNMPSSTSALHYPGTCLFEGTVLSVGRGTERPFQQIGAPWLDGDSLAARLEGYDLPGVRFEAVTFVPDRPGDVKFPGETVRGVRFVATDPAVYDPTRAAVAALIEARRLSGERWGWRESHFDRLAGTDRLRLEIEAGRSLDEITAPWDEERERFGPLREAALLYP